jgi:hypothetical protein
MGFWSFSKSDAGWLAFYYVTSFVICRFDISYHHAFQHPMPTLRAAWVAVPFAFVVAIVVKVRDSLKYKA